MPLDVKVKKLGEHIWSKSKSFKIFNIEFSPWQWFEGVLNLQLPLQLKMHIKIDLYYAYVVKRQSPLLKFCCLGIALFSFSLIQSCDRHLSAVLDAFLKTAMCKMPASSHFVFM